MAMKLNTGKVAFPIEFDNGDKQNIYFNPNDPDLMIRMKNLNEKVQDKINGLEDVELNEEGKPTQISQIETFEKMQNILKEELDYAFGGSVSEVVFKHCSPFAIVGGEYFVVQFIQAITPEIEKHIKKSNADVEKRMAKHIDKYKK
jgi:hypothetical protein